MADSDGLPEGFDALYAETVDRVYAYARARLGPHEAEDVASEVFTAALLALQRGGGNSVSEAWLISVTRNKVIDRWRAAHRRMAKRHLLLTPEPVDSVNGSKSIDRVTLALDALSPRYRSVLVLHYLDGHPVAEVADILGISFEAARSSMARARRSFRMLYEGAVVDG